MSHTRLLPLSFACALALVAPAAAQEGAPALPSHAETPTVTTAATAERVRFAAPNAVVQMRLEIYDEAGQKVLDTEQRGGNVLDWHLQSSSGERVADGNYLCVVTVKNLSGRFSQKIGTVTVSAQATTLRSATVSELNARQAQAVGPVESGDDGLTVMKAEDVQPVTVLANSGDEAQLARTRGALTFRVGDFFSGNDKEQMRLTEEGNLGIGTAKPKVKLDVAGTIRAREGFAFADGSKLNVNDKGALTLTNSNGTIAPNVAGTGTLNRVAKWAETGGAGTLGDSTITELNGNVGIGTNNPSGQLHIFGAATQDVFAGMGPDLNTGPAFNYGYAGSSFGRSAGFFNVRPDALATPPNPSLRFMTANVQRMIVTNIGRVGIGTTTPSHVLDVAGNINTSTQYLIGGSVVLNTTGTQNTFAGVLAGATGGGTNGSFFGFKAGTANTSGNNNSFFGVFAGAANQDGSNNSFFGEGAGAANTAGDNNAFFGFHAGVSNLASTNSFFGFDAGALNTTAAGNSYFGFQAGKNGTTATGNSFFGASAGTANTAGDNNSFFGFNAGAANTSGNFNAFFGGFTGVTNNTGIRNSFFGDFAGHDNTSGQDNSFVGVNAGEHNNTGVSNTFAGVDAGQGNTNGGSNAFFGNHAGEINSTGDKNTILGADADLASSNLTNATAIGAQAFVSQSNSLVLGSIQNVNGAAADSKVGIGTTTPAKHLHMFGAGDQEIAIESSDTGGRQWTLQSSRGASPFNGEFQIIDRTANASRLSILSTGNVGIGTTAPANRLHVVADVTGVDAGPTPAENVALIENTSTHCCLGVLALKLPDTPNSSTNYITFYANNASLGAIEGNNSGSVSLVGAGNDYAEWLPRLNYAEKIQPGEIVGLNGGRITKNTRGASQIMAVSTGPIVTGNDPGKQARGGYERVAFVGQVNARVRGTVHAGDFIVASGLNDGTGIAVSPERITAEQFEQVAGQAWETSADAGVKAVRIAVGLIRRDPTVRRLLEYSRHQADRIGALDARLTALEAQQRSTTARSSPLPVTRKKHRLVARLADAGAPRSVHTTAGTLR